MIENDLQASLLLTIRDDPDDDAARLIYADWLEDCGDFRAELIRNQCELANLPPDDPGRAQLAGQIQQLIKEFWEMCTDSLSQHFENTQSRLKFDFREFATVDFERGFISRLKMEAKNFAVCAAAILGRTPLVFELQLWNTVAAIDELEKMDELAYVDALRISGDQLQPALLRRLIESNKLANVSGLDLSANLLGHRGLRELCKGKWNRLQRFDYSANHMNDDSYDLLAEFVAANRIHSLNLRSCGPVNFHYMLFHEDRREAFQTVERLDLSDNFSAEFTAQQDWFELVRQHNQYLIQSVKRHLPNVTQLQLNSIERSDIRTTINPQEQS